MDEPGQIEVFEGIDASFLYAESAAAPMHTLKVAVFEPGSAQGFDMDALREAVELTTRRLAPLRRRLISVPGWVHHPRWIDVAKLDLDEHVEHVELDPEFTRGIGLDALEPLVGEFAERPLARDRPLWCLRVVTGLDGDRLAAIVKLHHSLADGSAALGLLSALTQVVPGQWLAPTQFGESLATARPRRMWLFWQAIGSRLRSLLALPKLIWRSFWGSLRARRQGRGRLAKLFSGPSTFFNRKLGRTRQFMHLELSLAELRAIKARFGVTLNDVLLALVSGAAARLRSAGLLDGHSLICSMPMAVPALENSGRRLQGNRVANAIVDLHDDLSDPGERILAIAAGSRAAKLNHELRGPNRLIAWAEFDAPIWQRLIWSVVQRVKRPPLNLIVSNVRGPGQPIYCGWRRIDQLWSVGPLVHRMGLNLTAWSYAGTLFVSILGDGSQWTRATLAALRAGLEDEHRRLLGSGPDHPRPSRQDPTPAITS